MDSLTTNHTADCLDAHGQNIEPLTAARAAACNEYHQTNHGLDGRNVQPRSTTAVARFSSNKILDLTNGFAYKGLQHDKGNTMHAIGKKKGAERVSDMLPEIVIDDNPPARSNTLYSRRSVFELLEKPTMKKDYATSAKFHSMTFESNVESRLQKLETTNDSDSNQTRMQSGLLEFMRD
jgi:hypothetical protein